MFVNNETNTTTESTVAVQDKQFNIVEIKLRRLNKDDTISFTLSTSLVYIRGGKCYAFFKRVFDILCSFIAIIFFSPVLIGPRQITRMEWHDHFTKKQREALLCVKPGLSGYWAAYARSEATFETGERQKLEMEYLKRRGFWFDIKLIFVTVFSVLSERGLNNGFTRSRYCYSNL